MVNNIRFSGSNLEKIPNISNYKPAFKGDFTSEYGHDRLALSTAEKDKMIQRYNKLLNTFSTTIQNAIRDTSPEKLQKLTESVSENVINDVSERFSPERNKEIINSLATGSTNRILKEIPREDLERVIMATIRGGVDSIPDKELGSITKVLLKGVLDDTKKELTTQELEGLISSIRYGGQKGVQKAILKDPGILPSMIGSLFKGILGSILGTNNT
ncbi:MAG: hypothetical protein A2255_01815 [Candidatus Melainabacteria bacterium RIFOXYA2_FULL_32_9]|nr:MAG: hypothetical protein A2255_01815 [Candidatus Melainabacteria bacterium RIFOXYA2_FULL_32_9]